MSDQAVVPEIPLEKKLKRYRSDRIDITRDGDGPFLKLIRNATFITHHQFVATAIKNGFGRYRQYCNHRVGRYITTGLVDELPKIHPYKGVVYSITRDGLRVLEGYGEGLFSVSSTSERLANAIQAPHFLEINDVRFALESDDGKTIQNWWTDREIASLNYSMPVPYAKDYDGIVEVKVGKTSSLKFGFEYERTPKTDERYAEIAGTIAREKQLKFVLYVTSSREFAMKLAHIFRCGSVPVCFTTAGVICADKFDAKVAFMLNNQVQGATLSEYIEVLAGAR